MEKIKIGYFADGPWSHNAFRRLISDDSIEIMFIVPRFDTQDNTLQEFSKQYKIDYLEKSRINSDEFYNKAKEYNCDLFVSLSFNQIFKDRIINLPRFKTINCHAGKLPFYRGRNILNWVLINDEKEFGITVHYIDEGIDTGDIIVQRLYPISDEDSYSTILEKAFVECAEIVYDSVKIIQDGIIERIKQSTINPHGFYCVGRTIGDEIIDWDQTSREIFNFIRAIDQPHGPGSRTYLNGEEIIINRAVYNSEFPVFKGLPGSVIGADNNKLKIKTKDSYIEVVEFSFPGKIKIGDRFENRK